MDSGEPRDVVGSTRVIVAAAGRSGRMGRCKALVPCGHSVDAPTFLQRILQTCAEVGLANIVVSVPDDDDDVLALLRAVAPHARTVRNAEPALGLTGTLRAALSGHHEHDDRHVLLWPVDCPLASVASLRALLEATSVADADAVQLMARDVSGARQPGHPVWFHQRQRPALLDERLPEGPRSVLRAVDAVGRLRRVEVDDVGVVQNLNTPEAWASCFGGALPSTA